MARQNEGFALATECLNEQSRQPCKIAAQTRGFTLVEIIVSFAILAIVSVSVLSAVMGMAGVQQRDSQVRSDGSTVERSIASDADPSTTQEGLGLPLGRYEISSSAETHSSGIGAYTVLNPGDIPPPEDFILDGDVSKTAPYTILKTGYYLLEVWGASGGGNGSGAGLNNGGRGGYASGIVKLEKGEELFLYAGGQGGMQMNGGGAGGANGGGTGGRYTSATAVVGGGGGASDIRINTNSNYARVIVAAGGGGAGSNSWQDNMNDIGGAAGGALGSEGKPLSSNYTGKGGTQSAGGATASDRGDFVNGPGIFAQGGSCSHTDKTGGGGGGGWYGGGAGSYCGGGGGSSWVFTQATYAAWTNSANKPGYLLTSTHWLQKAQIIAGSTAMPNPRNNNISAVGMSGNGYVRVSWHGTSVQ